METERICNIDGLQSLVRDSWPGWSIKIIAQADLEKQSNARLKSAISSLTTESAEQG